MLGLFGPKSGKIGVYKAAFIYQGPLKEDFSAGSPAINEVVLESHALRVYSPLMDTPERRAELLLHKILIKEIKPGAKIREIYRKQWSGLKTYESVVEALAILSQHGW